ncbi:hypothetical protein [Paenibacillus spongiae]|uniref:DUF3153 domain-containing protein n=1 Tax=Paenibacillus spongiae TaxID=2909671 RepID=A0ABY5S4V9_9BACL|nr:hypothetical protein [Paenibacillus spongiae]UVI28937.1 hypothetical protein L1F29_26375 [Paenibacillus spongiae]
MKPRLLAIAGMLFALFTMAGCAKGTAHVTIHLDGSIDAAAKISLDARAQKLVGTKVEDALENKVRELGYEFKKKATAEALEYQIQRRFASIHELREAFGNWDGRDLVVEKEAGFFYTRYAITGQIDTGLKADGLLKYIGDLNVSDGLARLFLERLTFDLKLTLPLNVFGEHNADEADGRTLTWHVPLTEPKPVQLEVYAPNVKTVLIVGGSGIAIIAAGVYLVIRRMKKRKTSV